MNTYLYAKLEDTEDSVENTIEKVSARSFKDCENKIINKYMELFEDLEEPETFDDFRNDLFDKQGIFLGKLYENNELF